MWRNVGIERQRSRLEESIEIIAFWSRYVLDKIFDSPAGWELQNMLEIAHLVARGAAVREETRGVHYRTDYPELDNAHWRKHIDWSTASEMPEVVEVGG